MRFVVKCASGVVLCLSLVACAALSPRPLGITNDEKRLASLLADYDNTLIFLTMKELAYDRATGSGMPEQLAASQDLEAGRAHHARVRRELLDYIQRLRQRGHVVEAE